MNMADTTWKWHITVLLDSNDRIIAKQHLEKLKVTIYDILNVFQINLKCFVYNLSLVHSFISSI